MDARERNQTFEAYGAWMAPIFDSLYASLDSSATVDFLAEQLEERAAIVEFGSGTGRISIPLAEAGFDVCGIDLSTSFLELHRAKDPRGRVELVRADFLDYEPHRQFEACLIVNSTLNMVGGQEEQLQAFRQADSFLRIGGIFVVETYSPFLYLKDQVGSRHTVFGGGSAILLDAVDVDAASQSVSVIRTLMLAGTVRTLVETNRYLWPSELDLMARLSGFSLAGRFGGWHDEPHTTESPVTVSVFKKERHGLSRTPHVGE